MNISGVSSEGRNCRASIKEVEEQNQEAQGVEEQSQESQGAVEEVETQRQKTLEEQSECIQKVQKLSDTGKECAENIIACRNRLQGLADKRKKLADRRKKLAEMDNQRKEGSKALEQKVKKFEEMVNQRKERLKALGQKVKKVADERKKIEEEIKASLLSRAVRYESLSISKETKEKYQLSEEVNETIESVVLRVAIWLNQGGVLLNLTQEPSQTCSSQVDRFR